VNLLLEYFQDLACTHAMSMIYCRDLEVVLSLVDICNGVKIENFIFMHFGMEFKFK
jgi:hypothetical protein